MMLLDLREETKTMIMRAFIERIIASPLWLQADPLRPYRLIWLAARFNLPMDSRLINLIQSTDFSKLDRVRVLPELSRFLISSAHPSKGLLYMLETGILKEVHPQLYALQGCRQERSHHPEGDVFQHTLLVLDYCRRRLSSSKNPVVLMLAALLHDIGKPATTGYHKGKVTSYGHDVKGSEMAASFMKELGADPDMVQAVQRLVREHMQPVLLYKQKDRISGKAIRRLLGRVDVDELLLLSEADYLGRDMERDYQPIRLWIQEATIRLKPPL